VGARGSEIVTVCLTRGEAGSNKSTPADMTRERLAKIREEEQRAACGPRIGRSCSWLRGRRADTSSTCGDLTRLVRRTAGRLS